MDMELIRNLILMVGWPVLVVGSIWLIILNQKFYRDTGKSVFGKLVFIMVCGWLISMYSLGFTASAFMLTDINGVRFVLPIFMVWSLTMVLIIWTTLRLGKEVVSLSEFYNKIDRLDAEKVENLSNVEKQLTDQSAEIARKNKIIDDTKLAMLDVLEELEEYKKKVR